MAADAGRKLPEDAQKASGPSHIVALARQTVVYGISGVALQAIGVITLPIFARVFTKSEYGKLDLATSLSAVAIAIADAGFASAAQRSFYDYSAEEDRQRRSVIFTALITTAAVSATALVVLLVLRQDIAGWLFGRRSDASIVVALGLTIPFVNAANFLRAAMRLQFRAWHYVVSSLLASVVAAGLGIVAVVVFDLGVRGVFYGVVAGNVLATVYGLFVDRHLIRPRFGGDELRKMLLYGLPLVPAAVALWALALVDRIMLAKLGNLAEVGQYAVANRIANVLLLGVTGFALAFGPYIFSLYSEDRALEKAVRAQALRFVTIALCLGGLVLSLFARELIDLTAPRFDRAYEAVGLLALAVVVFGISTIVMAGISYARRTDLVALITLAGAGVNIGLNFVLIPPYGMMGAAVANGIAYLVLTCLYYVVSQRFYRTAYEAGKVITIVTLASAIGAIGLVPLHPLALALGVKLAALVAFAVLLRITGVVFPDEIERLRELMGGMLRLRTARA